MEALRTEVESSDAEIMLLKQEFLRSRGLADHWASDDRSPVGKN